MSTAPAAIAATIAIPRNSEISARAAVLDEAAESELRPTATLRGQTLRIGGIVESTGLKKQTEMEGSGFATGSFVSLKTERVQRHYPYVVLEPEDKKPGRALCFFEFFEVDDIAKLAVGDKVAFEGVLQEFRKKDGQEVIVLHCSTTR